MRRAQQKSYAKSDVNWHSKNRQESELAAPIIVYESENPAIASLTDEVAFEDAIVRSRIEQQKQLEADVRYQKPSALAAVETIPFVGSQKFGDWLAQRREASIEEVLAYEEPRIQDEVEAVA